MLILIRSPNRQRHAMVRASAFKYLRRLRLGNRQDFNHVQPDLPAHQEPSRITADDQEHVGRPP